MSEVPITDQIIDEGSLLLRNREHGVGSGIGVHLADGLLRVVGIERCLG
jgi:hypothetical protein